MGDDDGLPVGVGDATGLAVGVAVGDPDGWAVGAGVGVEVAGGVGVANVEVVVKTTSVYVVPATSTRGVVGGGHEKPTWCDAGS